MSTKTASEIMLDVPGTGLSDDDLKSLGAALQQHLEALGHTGLELSQFGIRLKASMQENCRRVERCWWVPNPRGAERRCEVVTVCD